MKSNFLLGLLLMMTLTTTQANAGNLRCMPMVLQHFLRDFEQKRQAGGIPVVINNRNTGYRDQTLKLGENLEEEAIVLSDIYKNAYKVEIPLRSLHGGLSNLVVRTTVRIENYDSCRPIVPQDLSYSADEELN